MVGGAVFAGGNEEPIVVSVEPVHLWIECEEAADGIGIEVRPV